MGRPRAPPRLRLLQPLLLALLALVAPRARAWDSGDLELFDLVEEVPRNFYDFLGVQQVSEGPGAAARLEARPLRRPLPRSLPAGTGLACYRRPCLRRTWLSGSLPPSSAPPALPPPACSPRHTGAGHAAGPLPSGLALSSAASPGTPAAAPLCRRSPGPPRRAPAPVPSPASSFPPQRLLSPSSSIFFLSFWPHRKSALPLPLYLCVFLLPVAFLNVSLFLQMHLH